MEEARPFTGRAIVWEALGIAAHADAALGDWVHALWEWFDNGDTEETRKGFEAAAANLYKVGLKPWASLYGLGSIVELGLEKGWPTECDLCGGELAVGARWQRIGFGTATWFCADCGERGDGEEAAIPLSDGES